MSILTGLNYEFRRSKQETLTLDEYLELASSDSSYYLNAAERMLKAIGEPTLINTTDNDRLGRIFSNRVIKVYDSFKDFFGMEEAIEKIVAYFTHYAQGLEESKQILYLLGPVGGGKSSLAEKLKALMETQPFYAIEGSPVFDNPLGLFGPQHADKLNIPERYLTNKVSPQLLKRLDNELEGDISKLKVVKLYPNQARRIALTKTEPGDENNQDISSLVGKVDIRKLADYAPDDPDAYSYSGGLCRGNRGILEFVEMFKAPIKMLHPLLTATQEKNYNGTQEIGSIPFDGIVLAHSNESEWESFRNNKNNEAFIDRVYITEVPYCLRATEERKILDKLIKNSTLKDAPAAPHTLDFLAQFNVITRMTHSRSANPYTKMQVYDGRNVKHEDHQAKSVQEYKSLADNTEGFQGFGTRSGYKVLARTFNYDLEEVAANPVHLMICLQDYIEQEKLPDDTKSFYESIIAELRGRYIKELEKDIQKSYLDADADFSQNMFERYIAHAKAWCNDDEFRDHQTGQMYDREALNQELEKIEKPAGIANPKDFRHEVLMFALNYRGENEGRWPKWDSYEQMAQAIRGLVFSKIEDILPVLSFEGHKSKAEESSHKTFVKNMQKKGYTKKQIRTVVEWYRRFRNN